MSVHAHRTSSMAIAAEVHTQMVASNAEDSKVQKNRVKSKHEEIKQQRQERLDNLEERIKLLAKGNNKCLKALKAITMVLAIAAAPFTGGSSVAIAIAVCSAVIGALAKGLEVGQKGKKDKKLALNAADTKEITAIIQLTEKILNEEKSRLGQTNKRQSNAIEEYQQQLQDLQLGYEQLIRA